MASVQTLEKRIAERERLGEGYGTATLERIRHAGGEDALEYTQPDIDEAPLGKQRISAAPLDYLQRRKKLTIKEYTAGHQFRTDYHVSGLDGSIPSADWLATGSGQSGGKTVAMFRAQSIADARIRCRGVLEAIPEGTMRHSIMMAGLVHEHTLKEIGEMFAFGDRREAQVSGETAFRMVLAELVSHYRL